MKNGGVRVVMENIVHSIRAACPETELSSIILAGSGHCETIEDSIREKDFSHLLVRIKELNYTAKEIKVTKESVSKLYKKLTSSCNYDPKQTNVKTVVIGHNITLGKNPVLTMAFAEWARKWKEVLFVSLIHDFPEENRPENIDVLKKNFGKDISTILYPDISNMHFAVINNHAFEIMKKSGIPESKLHFIPNAILADKLYQLHPSERKKISKQLLAKLKHYAGREGYKMSLVKKNLLYPVRIIRRKNVLEAILFIYLLGKDKWQLWITQYPKNRTELQYWNNIRKVLKTLSVNVIAGFGNSSPLLMGHTINELYNISDAVVNTSLQEGFGFAYCEAWLTGKPVVGRFVKGITDNFEKKGMKLKHMYNNIWVPFSWTNMGLLKKTSLEKNCKKARAGDIGGNVEERKKDIYKTTELNGHGIDFSDLDTENQMGVLMKIEREGVDAILNINPGLTEKLSFVQKTPENIIKENADVVRNKYGPKYVGKEWLHVFNGKVGEGQIPINVHQKLLKIFHKRIAG